MTLERTEFTSLWIKEDGEYSNDYTLLTPEETGIGERTRSAPGATTIRGRNSDNEFVELATIQDAPTETDTFNVEFRGHYDLVQTLERYKQRNVPFYLQLLSFPSPPVDVRSLASKVEHYLAIPGPDTTGAGRNRDGSGGLRDNSITLNVVNRVDALLGISLSRITNANDTDALAIAILDRNLSRKTGYRGADKVIYVGMETDTTNPGDIFVSVNGGGSFAALATDPTPFTNVSGVNNIQWNPVSETQFRLLVSRNTDAAAKAMFAIGDVTYGSEATAPTWSVKTIAATSNGDFVTAMLWPQGIGLTSRIYLATAGDIYLSTDLGATDPGAAIYTGSNALNQFKADQDRNIWCVGASNTILVELANNRGTFVARTGPSGGGAFTAIERAKNGIIFAGNGQSLYRNTNEARSTGGWSSVKDFGSGYTVKDIVCVNGSSEIVRVCVSDATDGQVWYTFNGGLTWVETTAITNGGYAHMAKTSDPNKYYIVGKVETSTPVIALWA